MTQASPPEREAGPAPEAPADLLAPGTVVDERFLIEAVIGVGAFGVVYRAVDFAHGQVVALKTLRAVGFDRRTLVQRFVREARITAELRHPNTARLLHFGQLRLREGERPLPYMALELVRGVSLGTLVRHRGALTPDEVAWVCEGVLESLGEAHARGILHRDLKPDNVMVAAPEARWERFEDAGKVTDRLGVPPLTDPLWANVRGLPVKVVDFGLGKLLPDGKRRIEALTATGVVAGTAQYMSPEQVVGLADLDGRADLYALAALMYRVLTGSALFEGEDDLTVALKHVTEALPPLPEPLDAHPIAEIYRRAGAKDRGDRFASAAEMGWALRALPLDRHRAARPEPPAPTDPPAPPAAPGLLGRLLGRRRA